MQGPQESSNLSSGNSEGTAAEALSHRTFQKMHLQISETLVQTHFWNGGTAAHLLSSLSSVAQMLSSSCKDGSEERHRRFYSVIGGIIRIIASEHFLKVPEKSLHLSPTKYDCSSFECSMHRYYNSHYIHISKKKKK